MSEGGEARNHEEVEAVARLIRDESPYAIKHSTATRMAEKVLAYVRSSGSAAHPCTTCGHTSDLHSPGGDYLCRGDGGECRCQFFTAALTTQGERNTEKLVERIVEELCDPPSMRGDGGFEMGWRAAIRAVAEFGSVVPADEKAGRDTNNAPKKKGKP